ncbi:Lrp/AsnC family transcriptional regulator [Nitrincola sp. MINF-07-Sa-05]|uniref:Lrp/AsnC family transcriptional regulator n=1 Tax=Nitrincola salilacus TaxID=3400273 RepID=UPI0039183714
MLDRYDRLILNLLQKNARVSVSDISRQVFLSRSAVKERIRRLEENGTIAGYQAVLKPAVAGNRISAYFELTFSPLCCDEIQSLIEAIPEVRLAHSISGDVDLMLYVEVESMDRIGELRQAFDRWPNIKRVITHTSMATRARRIGEPHQQMFE